jgi:hypothetical protein
MPRANFNPASDTLSDSNCAAPFPRILWEIRDDQSSTTTAPFPTELSTSTDATTQDLGMTWSQPITGKVKISVGSSPRDFFVAIFGGGYSHTAANISATNASGNTGNFLYMVDIETGRSSARRTWRAGRRASATAAGNRPPASGLSAVIINSDSYLD